jgi:thiol-disulfide isomerase/thioredoxin
MKSIITKGIMLTLLMCFLVTISGQAQTSVKDTTCYITDAVSNFDQLISKFKGRVVFVDIWATWCGPCRRELQQQKEIHDFASFAVNKGVVILYICCDKDDYNWKQFITDNNLKGYHILINEDLDHDLHSRFSYNEMRGNVLKMGFYIPRHMIIDQNGKIVDNRAESQGSRSVYKQINKLLVKSTSSI